MESANTYTKSQRI